MSKNGFRFSAVTSIVLLSLLATGLGVAYGAQGDGKIDITLTPGAINTAVTEDNIGDTVCKIGFTKTIRPSESYTYSLKMRQLRSGYNLNGDTKAGNYEEDHMVPLSVGGAPKDEKNLWPQPRKIYPGAAEKDKLELLAWKKLCKREITLKEAQSYFLNGNWEKSYFKFFKK